MDQIRCSGLIGSFLLNIEQCFTLLNIEHVIGSLCYLSCCGGINLL